ncbi:MAG: yhfK 1 [Candidatus Saccharibacteria bacterium]|nr:yhfK 1 [Candidatus Saccharibacteria bacterium]
MNILLLGATGATGKEVLRQAQDAGHTITMLVRNPAKLPTDRTGLRIIVGDATDEKTMHSAMAENEILISTLGSLKAPVITQSTKAIIAAAKKTSVKRVIILSSFAAKRDQLTHSASLLTGMIMKNIIKDKRTGEHLLRHSSLAWTIVYAPTLTNARSGTPIRVIPSQERVGLKNKIARADVAAWILTELHDSFYLNKDVTISQ